METSNISDDQTNGAAGAELAGATLGVLGRLRQRGIVTFQEAPAEELVQLLEAVELFEVVAAARACDSFTNALNSSSPDDPACQLPRPAADDTIETYTVRVRAHIDALRSAGA
ncbi:MAG: hypothetical protein WD801_11325 [Gemmatimonadaceae bacterium]